MKLPNADFKEGYLEQACHMLTSAGHACIEDSLGLSFDKGEIGCMGKK